MRVVLPIILSLAGLLTAGSIQGEGSSEAARAGVVVEAVAHGSAGEKSGMQPSDLIVSWSRTMAPLGRLPASEAERIESAFDLLEAEIEQAPRGAVTLGGWRGH